MVDRSVITPELLRELIHYEPHTGKLIWKHRQPSVFKDGGHSRKHQADRWNTRWAGKEALTAYDNHGYRVGHIFRVNLKAHRIAWAIHHGAFPEKVIDHINHIRDDNRLVNLRVVTQAENLRNRCNLKPKPEGEG